MALCVSEINWTLKQNGKTVHKCSFQIRMSRSEALLVRVYLNGTILSGGSNGISFEADNTVVVKIQRNISLDVLKETIHRKLRLREHEKISRLLYRYPIQIMPLMFGQLQLNDDDDVEVMIDCHLQLKGTLTSMEVYADIEVIEVQLNTNIPDLNEHAMWDENSGPSTQFHLSPSAQIQLMEDNDTNILPPDPPCDILDDVDVDDIEDVDDDDVVEPELEEFGGSIQELMGGDDEVELVETITFYAPHDYMTQATIAQTDEPEIPDVLDAYTWDDDSNLAIGLLFPDKDALTGALKSYSIKRHNSFKVEKSCKKYLQVKCVKFGDGCNWRVRACLKKNYGMWMITKYSGDHTCVSSSISQDHRQLDSDLIATAIEAQVKQSPDMPISQVKDCIKEQFAHTISYKKAWMAKQKAISKNYGDWEASYSQLGSWFAVVRQFLPNTVVDYNWDYDRQNDKRIFRRVFWAYEPCIDAFDHLKPMIQADGTFLYGKYKGTLLIACGQDGNRHVLPLAFAIVEGETLEAWSFFLYRLRQHVAKNKSVCLITNKHASIKEAVDKVENGWQPPLGYHVHCMRHLASNLNAKFKNKRLKQLFVNIGYSYERPVVERKMIELQTLDVRAYNWVLEHAGDRAVWCRAYDEGRRWGHMTTNLVECMNGILKGVRSLPVTTLAQSTYYKLARYFTDRTEEANSHIQAEQKFCTYVRDQLKDHESKATFCVVTTFNLAQLWFEVQEPYDRRRRQFGRRCRVLLGNKYCDCGEFQALRFPCAHAIAACLSVHLDCTNFIDQMYSLETISAAYRSPFYPVGGEQYWPQIPGPKFVPDPKDVRKIGRPKSKRFKNEMDWKESSKPVRCGVCREVGHYRNTCPNQHHFEGPSNQ